MTDRALGFSAFMALAVMALAMWAVPFPGNLVILVAALLGVLVGIMRITRRTTVLGWTVIVVLGGGATIVAVALLAILLFVSDVFLLGTTPTRTSYLTIVRAKGMAAVTGADYYLYEVKDGEGRVTDAQLPWVAQPGDRVRMRGGRTRILRLTVPTEPPVLCPSGDPCD